MKPKELYKEYIREHIANVESIWQALQSETPVVIMETDERMRLAENIRIHDCTKYSRAEFEGYRQWFFPEEGKHKELNEFQKAWHHHQSNNPHHWEYWVMVDKCKMVPIAIPYMYILEMLIDWSAMSLKFGDLPTEFYYKNKENMILHDGTRKYIEKLLSIFNVIVFNIREKQINAEQNGKGSSKAG